MAGGELPDFLFVRSECLFSSAFIFFGSDVTDVVALFDQSIESRAADLVAGDDVFDGRAVIVVFQNPYAQVERISVCHLFLP